MATGTGPLTLYYILLLNKRMTLIVKVSALFKFAYLRVAAM